MTLILPKCRLSICPGVIGHADETDTLGWLELLQAECAEEAPAVEGERVNNAGRKQIPGL